MNACEDQSEPLGEAPAVDGGLLGLGRNIAAAIDLADRQARAFAEIRELHRPTVYANPDAPDFPCCHGCSVLASPRYVGYPCETIAILDRLEIES